MTSYKNISPSRILVSALLLALIVAKTQQEYIEQNSYKSECYNPITGKANKCMPEFTNAAYGLKIIASNTCGEMEPSEYCLQSSRTSSKFSLTQDLDINLEPNYNEFPYSNHHHCETCDNKANRHSADFLNDWNNQGNITWWQSDTMYEGIQYPNSVNLTLHLGKAYEINYVQIKFYSPRPESFAIYKKTRGSSSDWQPYQYYSASCERTYNKERNEVVYYHNEAIARCTDEFSDIAPMSGASVVFGTLEDRPSAYNFENSAELNEWVTATDIRITLNRLNTFGDEVFNDPLVLKSYYYAISGIAVGGRCKCHGHANKCSVQQQHDFEDRLACECKHFTTGIDCDQCLPFYNDAPWKAASGDDANECKPCNCNGLATKCHFNQTLYAETGHGGYCEDCEGNTEGPHCEDCQFGTFRKEDEITCTKCQCNEFGSESAQCDPFGRCRCRPGVIGEKCDRCAPNHYDLSITGCKECHCNPVGSFDSPALCDPYNGFCRCKANVEGQNCDRPKPGFFNLDEDNIHGALACFCYGHSSQCNSSTDFLVYNKTADFISKESSSGSSFGAINARGERVVTYSVTNLNALTVDIGDLDQEIYFVLSDSFTGDQTYSYNQDLSFTLEILDMKETDIQNVRPSRRDLVIESSAQGLEVYLPIYGDSYHQTGNPNLPSAIAQTFRFKLNQHFGWMPTLSAFDFQRLLSNISSIKIRASYVPHTRTLLSKLVMTSAAKLDSQLARSPDAAVAKFVEQCSCPVGYSGQHCQSCAYGYRRAPLRGGLFARCIPCTCNHHSESCDPDTGKCACKHHTNGDNCEKCENGFYGNALLITEKLSRNPNQKISTHEASNVCKKCPCPDNGACAEIFNYQLESLEVVCLECPIGTQGNLCELCDDGHFSPLLTNSTTAVGSVLPTCQKCTCNGNIDENAIGNCDPQASTELCRRCIYNTTGDNCERCLPQYWGEALSSKKCHACDCFPLGTYLDEDINQPEQCDLSTGQCHCKPNIKNRRCDECKNGYWNIQSGSGCERCKCNPLGSFNQTCDSTTGQCFCRPGVTGLKCDTCLPMWYEFSETGCKPCACDPFGTDPNAVQCDNSGKCNCRENFAGKKCDMCAENRFNFTKGCLQCDDCYNLVQTSVIDLRRYIDTIDMNLNSMLEAAFLRTDDDLKDENLKLMIKLQTLKLVAEQFHLSLFEGLKPEGYSQSFEYLEGELKALSDELKGLDDAFERFNVQFEEGREIFEQVGTSIAVARNQFDFIRSISEMKSSELDRIEKNSQESGQHRELQQLARTARETARYQHEQARMFAEEIRRCIGDANRSLEHLGGLVDGYRGMQADRESEVLELDYEGVRLKLEGLVEEAYEQKAILDVKSEEIQALIGKLNAFEIPEELLTSSDALAENNDRIVFQMNEKSISIRRDIEDLKAKVASFVRDSSFRSVTDAQLQLNTAVLKQKDIDYLLEIAQKTKNKSDVALRTTEAIFENATKIYEALKQSDELIMEGKKSVAKAVKLRDEIESTIMKSQDANRELHGRLHEMDNQLENVKIMTDESMKIMKHATMTFDNIEMKTNDLKNQIADLYDQTSVIKSNLLDIAPKSYEAANVYTQLDIRTSTVLHVAEEMTSGTQNLLDDANNAMDDLNRINKSIAEFSMASINGADIQKLEAKFDAILKEIGDETNIDESIESLEHYSQLSYQIVKQYEFQVVRLREQVLQLDSLNRTLKSECYANTIFIPEL